MNDEVKNRVKKAWENGDVEIFLTANEFFSLSNTLKFENNKKHTYGCPHKCVICNEFSLHDIDMITSHAIILTGHFATYKNTLKIIVP